MIVTLCGSARFEPWFHAWNEALTLAGHAVFSLVGFPSQHGGKKEWYTPEQKAAFDLAYREKIRASEAVVFLNVFAYMGKSTLGELAFARALDKKCCFLESWGEGIGLGHGSERRGRDVYHVSEAYVSPVATTSFPSPYDLLPPPGVVRQNIVTMLDERAGAAVFKGETLIFDEDRRIGSDLDIHIVETPAGASVVLRDPVSGRRWRLYVAGGAYGNNLSAVEEFPR